ncbi:MAG: OmpA family protein [Flavobacteriaceae bacterium CG_4_9_14_0_8_um_filter_34_30]|nr:MAG: OmpA family protein [Flavobacteriaceae bacterium CG_4_9_14_0_8_um_filter_34_30]
MKLIIFICCFLFAYPTQAQFWKKLGDKVEKAAERSVERTVEKRTDREVEKSSERVLDSILDAPKKKNNKRKKGEPIIGSANQENSTIVTSSKDFVSGSKVIYSDTFKNDGVGDFPVTWNTNSSGEVITFDNQEERWLQLGLGEFTPDGITQIPDNCTFEFDLTVSNNFDWYSDGIWVNIIAVKNRQKDFTQWSRFGTGTDGVRLRLKPKNFEYTGETEILTYLNRDKIIQNGKNTKQFTLKNKTVHVALWRQKNRLRVYLNEEKAWDIPRAFGPANYNSISFNTAGGEEEHFYISNLRLAIAGEDTRHALLETGKFETNEILFDVNKAIIKPSSFKILDELGQALADNPEVTIKIIGHTDSDGSADANLKLSEKRAAAIKVYLSNHFPITGNRMQVMGKGETEPIASNATPDGKAKNRRVEFIKL